MLSQSPASTAGNESTALSQSKYVSLTRSHPGEVTTSAATTPSSTTVEVAAIAALRRV